MRITDFAYGIPILPFAIVLAAIIGIGFWTVILIIGFLLWRASARVLRAEVLQLKTKPYIQSAEALGASDISIIFRHIVPNVAGMAILFFSLGIGYAILFQASLAFLGISNPFIPTWGVMIRNAYTSGALGDAWWWSLPPGIMISLTVLSTFLIGRGYETINQSNVDQ
jgi:peptide/nickel transport system permease protein